MMEDLIEGSKGGYSDITRLRIKNPHYNPAKQEDATNKLFYEITNSNHIRAELQSSFQDIYKLQPELDKSQSALTNFLCSDDDTKPLEELESRCHLY